MFANYFDESELCWKIEVFNHSLHYGTLLKILQTEIGNGRLNDVEELRNDGGYTVEVLASHGAFKRLCDFGNVHNGSMPGIDFIDGRREHEVHTGVCSEPEISIFIAWVTRKILMRSELCWVHKERNGGTPTFDFGCSHQRHVPFVKSAHCGN